MNRSTLYLIAAAAAAYALWRLYGTTEQQRIAAQPVPPADTPQALSVWDAITAQNAMDAQRGHAGIWSNLPGVQ